ncbi:hypothetical protein [Pisciglobus halotolerans]|uniref:Uncharacterized protein n=1 Tax=Pisciglobus halotolerans TaxID=745365 RepID=A0A1I3C260_9LACT|nr:hypothetical protein [Pisciglobus halotolerans]SFH68655.1 hypothetical protein SAMN04489868_11240 [Pisciglobus halotolerans]
MAKKKEELKKAFSKGSTPTEKDFHDLIDAIFGNKEDEKETKSKTKSANKKSK